VAAGVAGGRATGHRCARRFRRGHRLTVGLAQAGTLEAHRGH
jgi:hypothetical protein